MYGKIKFEDLKNNITGYLDVGSMKGKIKDYMTGYIE
jgi:hypothetical protein